MTPYPTQPVVVYPQQTSTSTHGRQKPSKSRHALMVCTVRVEAVTMTVTVTVNHTLAHTMTAHTAADTNYIPAARNMHYAAASPKVACPRTTDGGCFLE